ncbi:MAG: TetR/AcrR family transcriptional regulator [Halarcobacter ebronensis]|jgi:AcrR family transcriptional regulator|uniref:TetR/AcrR family transcriptional regulator n=1 Tax=Halarcobacter ebronensis TaxID=1462615 RepID=UPI003C754627
MKTREKILLIAEEEFSKLGYDGLSMNELVKKLEINKATVYYHFKDKRALYQTILENILDDLNSELESRLDTSLNSKELLKEYVKVYIQKIKERPTIVPLMLREIANFGSNSDTNIVILFEKMISRVYEILNNLDLKDKYKEIDPYLIDSIIYGTINNFYAIQMSDLPIGTVKGGLKADINKSLDFACDFITDIILDAICKE